MINRKAFPVIIYLILIGFSQISWAQNPVLPGYFADPSIKKFDGQYYLYVTTDGYAPFGNDGETFAWVSDNLIDWKPEPLKGLPNKTIWAPAIVKGKDNKYYLYCQNSVDYAGYVWRGDSPTGPFVKTNYLGGFDLEPFEDPVSKKVYVVSGSKEIFEMDSNVFSPTYLTKIVRKIPFKGSFFDFTEGPYIYYKNGFYYIMWAGGRCWQNSYNVRYAYSKSLEGPYVDGANNPLIKTDEKTKTIGPGHNSVIEIEGRYFMFYHKEDATREEACNYRFACVSEIAFEKNGTIRLLKPVDNIGKLLNKQSKYVNLAQNKDVFANIETSKYHVEYAVDGRNDTRWTTPTNQSGTLTVDLGKSENINAVGVDFEYPDKWHTYKIEYSDNYTDWKTLADHSSMAVQGYTARLIEKDVKARYVRLFVKNSEDRTASVWELRVLTKAK